MSTIPPETMRANRWLLVGLVAFAIALTVVILVWMRFKIRANGGIVDPQTPPAAMILDFNPAPARA